jgi:phage N-6-adenine-methyltransferase
MKTGPTIARGKSKQDYHTPWDFIHACEKKFMGKMIIDLAASAENAKAPVFFTEAQDSLSIPWHKQPREFHQWFWLNPPFDNIAPWAKKCAEESTKGAAILFLTPASVGSNWFRDFVYPHAEVHGLNGRIQFVGADDPYPKDCILSAFYPALTHYRRTGFKVWTWPNDVPPYDPMNDPAFQ